MSKKLILSITLLLTFMSTAIAQEGSRESEGKEKKNDLANKFFIAISTSTYTDIIISPLKYHYGPTGIFDPITQERIYGDIPYQTKEFNIFSMGIEPRFNLKDFNENFSLSISAPISIGIGSSYSAAADELVVKGTEGFGSIQIPLLLKLNLGNGSTYTTQKDFGFSAGAGFEMNKVGIISSSSSANSYNKAFVLPCISTGFTFMRGNSPMEINIKYSFGKLQSQDTDAHGKALLNNLNLPYTRDTRGKSIKLSFVYLMNY